MEDVAKEIEPVRRQPGYCSECGTVSLTDFMECGGERCWWVNIEEQEPRRAA